MLVADPTNPNFQIQEGEAKARGLELGAQAAWRGFTIDAATPISTPRTRAATASPACPQNQASAWLQYAADGRLAGLTAGFGVRYVGDDLVGRGRRRPT